MKKHLFAIFCVSLFFSCKSQKESTSNKISSTSYQTKNNNNTAYLYGTISESVLVTDTLCKNWFIENKKYGMASAETIAIFSNNKNNFELLVFGGTWCEDTHNLLPKLFKVLDQSNFDQSKIKVIAVDLNKKAPNNLHTVYSISNVPTFIILQKNKEVGRVVEYGKTGDAVKEIADIIKTL